MKKLLLSLLILITSISGLFAQEADTTKQNEKKIDNTLKLLSSTIAGQKTANSKDLLSSFFRAGIDNLLGDDHSFTISPTLFALDSIFRSKNSPISYARERVLRRTSLTFGITGDTLNNIKKFTGGATISLLNKTDIKTNEFSTSDRAALLNIMNLIDSLKAGLIDYLSVKSPSLLGDFNQSWNEATKTHDFSKLSPFIVDALKDPDLINTYLGGSKTTKGPNVIDMQTVIAATLNGKDIYNGIYQEVAAKYAHKAIWTFSPLASYDRSTKQGEFTFSSNFTTGLGINRYKKPLELEIRTKFTVGNDTLIANTNYRNQPFIGSIGLNKVLLENDQQESKMEFKFFTQYEHQFGSAAKAMDRELFSLNSTLRINVFKSLWIPLTIKYDPKNANVFGYFSFTANLGN